MAIAAEQEMRARVQEMQSKVIEAQAEVPLALAEAFRQGNLGVMDFYRMQNIMATPPCANHSQTEMTSNPKISSMDDLIPFLIFVAVALINLIKTAIERSGAKPAPRPAPRKATPAPQESPTTLEEFFETISEQFGIEEEAEEEEDFFEPQEPIILKKQLPP